MNLAFTIIGIITLSVLSFQDFKYRKISWVLLPLLFIFFIFKGFSTLSYSELSIYFFVNFSFIVLQFAALTIYFSVKNKKLTNIINQYIGIGDLLFFVVLCAAFSPVNFIFFYCTSLFVSLAVSLVFYLISRKAIAQIPLAGIFSVVFVAVILLVNVIPSGVEGLLYNDSYLINIML